MFAFLTSLFYEMPSYFLEKVIEKSKIPASSKLFFLGCFYHFFFWILTIQSFSSPALHFSEFLPLESPVIKKVHTLSLTGESGPITSF
jgi:hypothetical protein